MTAGTPYVAPDHTNRAHAIAPNILAITPCLGSIWRDPPSDEVLSQDHSPCWTHSMSENETQPLLDRR